MSTYFQASGFDITLRMRTAKTMSWRARKKSEQPDANLGSKPMALLIEV